MSDSEKPNAKGTPLWQLQKDTDTPFLKEQASSKEPEEGPDPSERTTLVENATKFLEDEDVRNTPIERKQYFLRSKGLTDNEIQDLLQRQHTTEGDIAEGFAEKQQQQVSGPGSASESDLPRGQSSASPEKDVIPVITYPEFLIHSQKPPPLITAQRLLTTLYLTFGASATIYGTNKYIVEPMVENLSSARHSLFENASSNLSALNEKLEKAVSKIPGTSPDSDDSEFGSVKSDAGEFFTRSAATQTSPDLFDSSSPDSSALGPQSPPVVLQEAALSDIHDRLDDLLPADVEARSPVRDNLDNLRKYLEGLAYGDSLDRNRTGDIWNEDPVANVKAEIRGMKGLLLSARNFPSGGSVR